MASKTVSGPLSDGRRLLFENPIIAAILLRLVADTVTTKTHDAYAWKVKQLGGHSFMRFALHLADEASKPCRPPSAKGYSPLFREATSTLRHLKSACIHIALIHNEPWSAEDSAFADLLVRGYEGQNTQPRRRAGLSVPQLQAFLAEARERGYYDVADGALVQWAACARPRDMDALCLDRTIVFEDNHFAMFIEQKKRRADKMREGPDVLRLIQSETAQQIMRIRYETFREYGARGSDLFFPGYTTKRVSEVLAFVAARDKWPEGLLYDGRHLFRHGCATDSFAQSVRAIRERGGWTTDGCAVRYGTRGVAGQPAAEDARRQQAADKARLAQQKRQRARHA
jgi:hypothetical protein